MGATIRLSRSGAMSPGCLRPLQVLVDQKKVQPIKAGETQEYVVMPGVHRIQVKQDFSPSTELRVSVEEGAAKALECGSFIEGWKTFFFIFWTWRVLVPGKLFYVREPGRRRAVRGAR